MSADRVRVQAGAADAVVAVVIGFLFLADLWGAYQNFVGLPPILATARIAVPWVPLVTSLVVPPLFFAGALILGRGRPSFARALILIVALAADSALQLSLYFVTVSVVPMR